MTTGDVGRGVRTILVVAGRELYEHLGRPFVWGLLAVAAVLALLSTRLELNRLEVDRTQHDALVEQRAADRARSMGIAFGWQVERGLRVVKPPEPLRVLVTDGAPIAYWDFGPAGVHTADSGAVGSPPALVDLEFIIRIVLGLLGLCLAIESVAGERSTGSLLALLGQPVRPGGVIAGKVLGASITLAASLTVVGGIVLVAVVSSGVTAAPVLLGGLGALMAVSMVYLMTCWGLGALFGLSFSTYQAALVATVIVWSLSSFVAFPAMAAAEQSLWSLPSLALHEAQRDERMREATAATQRRMGDEFARALGGPKAWLSNSKDPRQLQTAQARVQPLWDEHQVRAREDLARFDETVHTSTARRTQFERLHMLLNPAAAYRASAANVAGVGAAAKARWRAAVHDHQERLRDALFSNLPRVFLLAPLPGAGEGPDQRVTVTLDRRPAPALSGLPAFMPPVQSLETRLRDAAGPAIWMLCYAALLLAAVRWRFGSLEL